MGRRVISILLMSATFLTACVCCAMEVAGDGSDDYGVLNDKLYAAARRGQVDRVRFLIDSGADPNAHHPMRLGETPLHAAVKAANPALIRLLIEEFHVDRSAQDETGKTPLHLAIDLADRDTVRLLLERGVDSSVSDNAGETPLHKAVMAGDKCLVRKLIAAGASRDAVDIYCQTPLYQACAHGFTAAVRMLLDVCADPNRATHAPQRCRGQRSMTPLMVAIQRVRGKIVRMLLAPEVAVDLEARNDAGETVLDIARRVADDGE